MQSPIGRTLLGSFRKPLNVAVIGASGGIGSALIKRLMIDEPEANIYAFSRRKLFFQQKSIKSFEFDLENEELIAEAAHLCKKNLEELSATLVLTGFLHDDPKVKPEKSWRSLNAYALEKNFRINTIGPALVAKHFLPLLKRDSKSVFACLSARVGSIQDNNLGGWYAYRASKAALNMVIKTLSIELARINPKAVCVGLHPGTVDTALSKPFQTYIKPGTLFSPEKSATALLSVIDGLNQADTGKTFAWDGKVIPF